jgi:glycosyltransferase involved in cell wall biosynthesis
MEPSMGSLEVDAANDKGCAVPPISVVLCSYSHGIGNGIAHVDQDLITGFDPSIIEIMPFVLRTGWPRGRKEVIDGAQHISLSDAYAVLREHLATADILHVNGAFDPVACHAAKSVGTPAIVEVMHQIEPGGLHEDIDIVVCVSELVRSVQTHSNTKVVHNGIDTDKFAFKPGRRDADLIHVIQVSNQCKKQHCELGDVVKKLKDPRVKPVMVGSRHAVAGIDSLGVVHDMPRVYHQADIHFLIENKAALGLVFLEGLACGTLPVVSADSGLSSVIHQEKVGWVVDPTVKGQELGVLQEAIATVSTPEFLCMQKRGRALVEERFSKKRMIAEYQSVYQELAKKPRDAPKKPEAWMHLALFVQLYTASNIQEAIPALVSFARDPRPIEPYFLKHPIGNTCVAFVLTVIGPAFLSEGYASFVSLLCKKFRQSRCITPYLDSLEQDVLTCLRSSSALKKSL